MNEPRTIPTARWMCPLYRLAGCIGCSMHRQGGLTISALIFLILPDGLIDFGPMAGVILPGGSKLGLGQRLFVAMADVVIGHPKPLSLDEHPVSWCQFSFRSLGRKLN